MSIEHAYGSDLAYIHDAGHGSIARDAAWRLVEELIAVAHREGTIVDLGCGSSTLAHHLVDAGYRVLGIDVSEAMVLLARAAAPDAEFRIGSFVSADLPVCVAVTAVGEVLTENRQRIADIQVRSSRKRREVQERVPWERSLNPRR